MLKTKELDTKPAGRFAFAAARDATRYSDECRMLYTARQRAAAETFMDIVSAAYSGKQIYLTYRKTFITVKVDGPTLRDRRVRRELDAICEERGYEKVQSAQGIVYRIKSVV